MKIALQVITVVVVVGGAALAMFEWRVEAHAKGLHNNATPQVIHNELDRRVTNHVSDSDKTLRSMDKKIDLVLIGLANKNLIKPADVAALDD